MCKQDNIILIVKIIFLPLIGAPFQCNFLGVGGDSGGVLVWGGGVENEAAGRVVDGLVIRINVVQLKLLGERVCLTNI